MNNTNSNSNTSCTLNNNNNNSNISSPVAVPNVQSPNSQLSQQSKMTDSHQSIDEQLQRQTNQLHHQPHLHPQSVFTIEQIELIRRLRRTNLSINQFIEAYTEMQRLEDEMIDKKDNLQFDNTANSIAYALNNSNLTNSQQQQIAHQQLIPGHYQNNSHNQLASLTNHYNNLQNHQPNQINNSFQSDDNIELVNFKKKGEQAMLLEIRSFVSKHNVRQSMISEATGISQGYISTFFHGEKMSEKRKNIIYQWYLTYSKNPSKLAADRQQMSLNSSNNSKFNHDFNLDNSNHFGSNNDVLFPITRRDRFIFRKQHLKILERFFEENPYPEIHAKEQIVEECNLSAEKSSGKPLKEADKVTVAIVSNWFNNKRKNARSKHLKNQYTTSPGIGLGSHSLNSSTGSANLSQSSNPGYNLQNSPSPASSSYLAIQQQQQQQQHPQPQQAHQLQQQNHQQDNFESNYSYECNYNQNNQNSNNQPNPNDSNQMHNIVHNPSNNIQFKNEPQYNNYLDNCFNKLPNTSSTNSKSDNETDLQDHDGSNISEFSSSQASYNGNDSIDN